MACLTRTRPRHLLAPPTTLAMNRLPLTLLSASMLCLILTAAAETEPLPSAAARERLTPAESSAPRINGARVVGIRLGSPILFTIAASGERPMHFSADGLPLGMHLDPESGRITGSLSSAGEHIVTLRATNAHGSAERRLKVVVGERIALTPPLGWNSWYCWGDAVSQEKVLTSARAMVDKGLRDHGWTYINIDDGWQGTRGRAFNAIQPNAKFPDIKALIDSIHAMGLKFGIYSTPWRGSYAGYIGSSCDNPDGAYDWMTANKHNEYSRIGTSEEEWRVMRPKQWRRGQHSFVTADVRQWAEWGVDYLKYDWYPNDVPQVDEMRTALAVSGRDIVLSLSNKAPYGLAADWSRLANAWRTTGDISDNWPSVSAIGFHQDRWAPFTGPGHWSDPDMLVVGRVGCGSNLHPTNLTADEQYTHISLWSLLAAPLLISCDLAQLDDFTLGLLTNDEVIDVDQDPLGLQATQISSEGAKIIYAKELEDGSCAVGLFNTGETRIAIAFRWKDYGDLPRQLTDRQRVRDLWRQKDLGVFDGSFEANVAPHGVVLLRLIPES
jgi:alpha-galactosidase